MANKILNTLTGIMGFCVWVWLVRSTPSHAINLALGVLLMLIGFAGKETIVDIIKSWKH